MEREVGGGIGMGNTCKPMAVSFQCMTKSTTNKKKKKKKLSPKKKKRKENELKMWELQGRVLRKEFVRCSHFPYLLTFIESFYTD